MIGDPLWRPNAAAAQNTAGLRKGCNSRGCSRHSCLVHALTAFLGDAVTGKSRRGKLVLRRSQIKIDALSIRELGVI